jgi:hypothetical protein
LPSPLLIPGRSSGNEEELGEEEKKKEKKEIYALPDNHKVLYLALALSINNKQNLI